MTIDVGDNDFRCYPLDELDKVTLMKEVLDCEFEIRLLQNDNKRLTDVFKSVSDKSWDIVTLSKNIFREVQ